MRRGLAVRPVVRRGVIAVLVSGVLAVMLVVLETIDVQRAVAAVVVALALTLVAGGAPHAQTGWRRPPADTRPGARKDVSELAWAAFARDGRVTERVLRRLRRIAASRLAVHGVAWDGRLGDGLAGWGRAGHDDAAAHRDRAATLLGPEVLAQLTTARAAHPRTANTWLDALERLAETPAPAPDPPRSPR